jgi:putative membrane protein
MYWGWGFWGMNIVWWLFWIVAIAVFFSLATPVPRSRWRERRETPLDVLQRRYAAGELTTAEYDERRARLLGDGVGRNLTQNEKREPPPSSSGTITPHPPTTNPPHATH